jgi:hypothetical protein
MLASLLTVSCVAAPLSPAEEYERRRAVMDAEMQRCRDSVAGSWWFPAEFDSEFGRCWYQSALTMMKERPLWPPKPGVEVYRFTFLPWRGVSRVARVDLGTQVAEAAVMSGNGDAPGVPVRQTHEKVEAALADRIRAAVDAPGALEGDPKAGQGRDGAEWILEAVRDGKYDAFLVWSGHIDDHPAFRDLCLLLVEAGAIQPPRK